MPKPTRRTVIAGSSAAVLTACGTYGTPPVPTPAPTPTPGPATSGAGGATLATTADIEVGGGTVFPEQQVVITQPQAGTFKAFTAICTHQSCTVASVTGPTINCPCHGSKYNTTDGSVVAGPAPQPLTPKTITIQGGSITLG